jgi:MinD-like ATPase involved in chromosome partitioning or flagellar assembly
MTVDHYVVLGVARPRAEWFRDVAQWATTAMIPVDFLKCLSLEEVKVRLAGGRRCSALLLDSALLALDRELIEDARETGCAVLVVDEGGPVRDWPALGVAAVLPAPLARDALVDALAAHARAVDRVAVSALDGIAQLVPEPTGAVAAVCGPGGTGVTSVASALAHGLVSFGRQRVLLADLARHAEQAVLHDVRDVVPGVQELVELHRNRRPADDEIRALTFDVVDHGYHLLLGLRQAGQWTTIRPRSWSAAFESLRRCFGVTVCDVTADFEGEDETGSTDVEDRNLLARTAVRSADVVLAVGRPGVKGTHALVRVLVDLVATGVPADRIVPVLNEAPRHPKVRAELASALADLASPAMSGGSMASPVFLPSRRVDAAWRDAAPIPAPLPGLLAGAFEAVRQRVGAVAPTGAAVEHELVRPGSLGHWAEEVG